VCRGVRPCTSKRGADCTGREPCDVCGRLEEDVFQEERL